MQQAEQLFDEKKYLTIQDLSQYLGIKTSTLYAMVEERNIPHYRLGRLVRFKRSEIDLWMEGNRKECLNPEKVARKALRPVKRTKLDVDRIVKKTIEEVKGQGYTKSYGKPDQVKGLGKEAKNGTF